VEAPRNEYIGIGLPGTVRGAPRNKHGQALRFLGAKEDVKPDSQDTDFRIIPGSNVQEQVSDTPRSLHFGPSCWHLPVRPYS
jgi:hypothetical protein